MCSCMLPSACLHSSVGLELQLRDHVAWSACSLAYSTSTRNPACSAKALTTSRMRFCVHQFRGAWMCHRCGASGSWYDLKRRAGSGGARILSAHEYQTGMLPAANAASKTSSPNRADGDKVFVAQQRASGFRPVPEQQRVRSYPANLMHNPRYDNVKAYLSGTQPGQRGIQPEVLIKYGVGCATYR